MRPWSPQYAVFVPKYQLWVDNDDVEDDEFVAEDKLFGEFKLYDDEDDEEWDARKWLLFRLGWDCCCRLELDDNDDDENVS